MKKHKKLVAGIILALIVIFVIGWKNGASADNEPATDTGYWGLAVPHAERFMLYPCTSKSIHQKPCYWNAREHGNYSRTAEKSSFWVIRVGNQVCKRYWDRTYDRHHGRCVRW